MTKVVGFAWFVRVTLPHTIIAEKMKQVLGWIDLVRVLAIGHKGDKTEKEHVHILLHLSKELQKQSLDVRLKNVFGVKGADYSSKPWDGKDSAGGYMFHDVNYVVLGNKNFSDTDIQRYQKLNDDTQKVIAINKERGGNKSVEAVLEIFKGCRNATADEIGKEFLRRVRDGHMYDPGDWKLRSMIEEVRMKLCEGEEDFNNYAFVRLNRILK